MSIFYLLQTQCNQTSHASVSIASQPGQPISSETMDQRRPSFLLLFHQLFRPGNDERSDCSAVRNNSQMFLRSNPSSAPITSALRNQPGLQPHSGDERDCVLSLPEPHQQLLAGFRKKVFSCFVLFLIYIFSTAVGSFPFPKPSLSPLHPHHLGSAFPGLHPGEYAPAT